MGLGLNSEYSQNRYLAIEERKSRKWIVKKEIPQGQSDTHCK
jgi:hypothetical protein